MTKRLIFILALLLLVVNSVFAAELNCEKINLAQIQNSQKQSGYSPENYTQWFEAKNPHSVALVSHGLNAKTQIMQPLINWLNSKGVSALRITMAGHGESMEEFKAVSRDLWVEQMKQAYCLLDQRAQSSKLTKYFVGYSLGTIVFSDFYTQYSQAKVDKMLLFAPPFELTPFASTVQHLFWANKLIIPSLVNVGGYRAHWGVPMPAYKALFDAKKSFENSNKLKLKKTPAMVIIDKEDELVSFNMVQKWMLKSKMFQWEFFEVDNSQSPLTITHDHMITEEKFLGHTEWQRLLAKLDFYLKKPSF